MKEMHVLGMELKDYSAKEAMRMVETFLQEPKISTISFLTQEILLSAQENEKLHGYLSHMDLTVPVSSDIVEAAGIGATGRVKEIDEHKFYIELMKKLSDEERTAFVLSDTEEQTERLKEFLQNAAPNMQILGSYSMDLVSGDDDQIVNEINAVFADIVFSGVSSPRREQFICKHKDKMNARLFIAMQEDYAPSQGREKLNVKIKRFTERALFRAKAAKYTRKTNKRGKT